MPEIRSVVLQAGDIYVFCSQHEYIIKMFHNIIIKRLRVLKKAAVPIA